MSARLAGTALSHAQSGLDVVNIIGEEKGLKTLANTVMFVLFLFHFIMVSKNA